MEPSTVLQTACFAIFSDRNEILLCKLETDIENEGSFWVTPATELNDGKDPESVARQELFRQTGIKEIEQFGPCIWKEKTDLNCKGKTIELIENFFLVKVASQEVSRERLTSEEKKWIKEFRWFSAEELETIKESLLLKNFIGLCEKIFRGEIPTEEKIECVDKA